MQAVQCRLIEVNPVAQTGCPKVVFGLKSGNTDFLTLQFAKVSAYNAVAVQIITVS